MVWGAISQKLNKGNRRREPNLCSISMSKKPLGKGPLLLRKIFVQKMSFGIEEFFGWEWRSLSVPRKSSCCNHDGVE
jgi:hypothetical protein